MKVYLKLLQDEKSRIKELREAVKNLDIEKIDFLKSNLLKNKFDLILDEKELPKEFDDYLVSYKNLEEVYSNKINSLIKKAKKEKKDILVLWGNYEEL